jgi:Protein of unknown function (DUF1153)
MIAYRSRGIDDAEEARNRGPRSTALGRRRSAIAGTKRWVIRRKAHVVDAVRSGLLSLEQACSRYALNIEEFRAWE